MKLKYNQNIILQIKDSFIQSKLKPKIVSLIFHGSGLFRNIDTNDRLRDLDFELILYRQCNDDFEIIQDILIKSPVKIECQVRYFDEISNPQSLIFLSNYKVFMFFAYANGVCLIGKNIYKDLIKIITPEQIRQGSLISAQIHFKDVRKSYLRNASIYETNKNLMRFFKEVCVFEYFLDYHMTGTKNFYRHEINAFVLLIKRGYKSFLSLDVNEMLSEFLIHYKNQTYYIKTFILAQEILKIFEKRQKCPYLQK